MSITESKSQCWNEPQLELHTEIELLKTLIVDQEKELRSLKKRLLRKDIVIDQLRKRIHDYCSCAHPS
ncbi:MAG: hypothetical protein ACFFCD_04635 [Promethearchaeota archaeon]